MGPDARSAQGRVPGQSPGAADRGAGRAPAGGRAVAAPREVAPARAFLRRERRPVPGAPRARRDPRRPAVAPGAARGVRGRPRSGPHRSRRPPRFGERPDDPGGVRGRHRPGDVDLLPRGGPAGRRAERDRPVRRIGDRLARREPLRRVGRAGAPRPSRPGLFAHLAAHADATGVRDGQGHRRTRRGRLRVDRLPRGELPPGPRYEEHKDRGGDPQARAARGRPAPATAGGAAGGRSVHASRQPDPGRLPRAIRAGRPVSQGARGALDPRAGGAAARRPEAARA